MIWAVWASATEEKALSSLEMSDVDAVTREGVQETSSDVMPWKLEENPADPVVSAVSLRYFSALYMNKVFVFNSGHRNQVTCSLLGGFSKTRAEVIQLLDSGLCSI